MKKNARAGYSLLEVLVAFAIMSLTLSVLIPGQGRLLQSASQQEERFLAQDYAISRMETLGISRPVRPGRQEGRYRDWRWEEVLRRVSVPDLQIEATEVEIKIWRGRSTLLARLTSIKPVEDR